MLPQRKIAHIDMDCFYAAIEVRDKPSLQGKPVAVGGDPGRRGVLCTCNYEARKFGVRSALPSSQALKLCPGLVLLPVDMPRYKAESEEIAKIIHRYTELVEPLSLDEAYLDLTGSPHFQGSASLTMQDLRQAIFRERHLYASAGVAPNKFLAKVASDWKKPNGFFAIPPEQVSGFVGQLPVGKIPGVGKVMESRLGAIGLKTCADLQSYGRDNLVRKFGGMGFRLFDLARGIDEEPLVTDWVRKSLSVEDTFVQDIQGAETCLVELYNIYHEFLRRLGNQSDNPVQPGGRNQLFVKIKYGDFRQTTIERSFPSLDFGYFQDLFFERYGASPRPVRLLGLGLRWPDPQDNRQLRFALDTGETGEPKAIITY